ncbi:MAG: hypothetical protein KIS87_08870 [Phycisphaeraceae bacterium]|nr:hypothetical protein [Phycisphaeraceae bacterium]
MSSEVLDALGAPRFRPLRYEGGVREVNVAGFGRFTIPKDPVTNLAYRRDLLLAVEDDPSRADVLRAMCAASYEFWCNSFAWTYRQMKVLQDGRMVPVVGGRGSVVPFITWPCQDENAAELEQAIEGGWDVALDKSRDMGASWLVLSVFHRRWQFLPDSNFLEVSRKLDLVDNAEDPDSLFWKHDFLNHHQPPWLVPRVSRARTPTPRLANLDLRSTIVGQSTTSDVGHGGRKTACLFDEAARMRELKSIWEGAASMTGCRIAASTPRGPVFFSKLVRSPQVKTLRLPWWDHPEKGVGRTMARDPATDRVAVTSPWREQQKARAVTRRELAENVDMDHAGAGYTFFDNTVIVRQLSAYAGEPPAYVGALAWRASGPYTDRDLSIKRRELSTFVFGRTRSGPLLLWTDLADDGKGRLRPPQDRVYVIGADISAGVGASESVLSVFDPHAAWKVATLASGELDPAELARAAAMLGYWFGGRRGFAFIAWEANGPGSIFGRHLVRLGYPWLYKDVKHKELTQPRKPQPTIGFWSDWQRKVDLLEDYEHALASDRFRNPDPVALEQCLDYVWMESGEVGPGGLETEGANARKTHGDRVIADAIAWHAARWAPRLLPSERVPPPGSPAERRERSKEREAKRGRRTSGKAVDSWRQGGHDPWR